LIETTPQRKTETANSKQAVRPVVGPPQYAPAPSKWQLKQPPTAFSLEVTAHDGNAGHRIPSVYQF